MENFLESEQTVSDMFACATFYKLAKKAFFLLFILFSVLTSFNMTLAKDIFNNT